MRYAYQRRFVWKDEDFCECGHLKIVHGLRGCSMGRFIIKAKVGEPPNECKCRKEFR